jgi:hypothetical protein
LWAPWGGGEGSTNITIAQNLIAESNITIVQISYALPCRWFASHSWQEVAIVVGPMGSGEGSTNINMAQRFATVRIFLARCKREEQIFRAIG